MPNTIPDYFRKQYVESLFSTNTLKNCWPIWKTKINEILGDEYNETNLIDLGDRLTEVF